jgi:hypothetical protein
VFRAHNLEVHEGSMSTVIIGEDEAILDGIKEAFRRAASRGDVVMQIVLSNACPAPTGRQNGDDAGDPDTGGEEMDEVTVRASELDWAEAERYPPKVHWKLLRRDHEGRPKAAILKLDPGFEMNAHTHVYIEHHYVFQGEYESQGKRYPSGTYRMIPAHKDHGPFRSATGALLLVLWEQASA